MHTQTSSMAQCERIRLKCRRRRRCRFDSWVEKIPWRRAWYSTSVFLLEDPMDRGDWQATVFWVEKSQTQLK